MFCNKNLFDEKLNYLNFTNPNLPKIEQIKSIPFDEFTIEYFNFIENLPFLKTLPNKEILKAFIDAYLHLSLLYFNVRKLWVLDDARLSNTLLFTHLFEFIYKLDRKYSRPCGINYFITPFEILSDRGPLPTYTGHYSENVCFYNAKSFDIGEYGVFLSKLFSKDTKSSRFDVGKLLGYITNDENTYLSKKIFAPTSENYWFDTYVECNTNGKLVYVNTNFFGFLIDRFENLNFYKFDKLIIDD